LEIIHLVRFFTPIPEPVQAMKVNNLFSEVKIWKLLLLMVRIEEKFLGIENGESYSIDKDLGKVFNKDNEVKLYLRIFAVVHFASYSCFAYGKVSLFR
jgi:hypothetical protein